MELQERVIPLMTVTESAAAKIKQLMAERIAFHTGQTVEQIEADSDRDRWFTAEQAQEYGLIDHVINNTGAVTPGPVAAPSLSGCSLVGTSVSVTEPSCPVLPSGTRAMRRSPPSIGSTSTSPISR